MSTDTNNAPAAELHPSGEQKQGKAIHKDGRILDKMMRLVKDKSIHTKELKNES